MTRAADQSPAEITFRRAATRILAVPLGAVLVLAVVLLWQVNHLLDDFRWVDHTDDVIVRADETLRLFVDMETDVRGYLLTGLETFLGPYRNADAKIDTAFDRLARLVPDNPSQVDRVGALRELGAAWRAQAADDVRVRSEGVPFDVHERTVAGKERMDALRSEFAAFIAVEQSLRASRSREAQETAQDVEVFVFVAMLLLGAFLAFSGRRQLVAVSRSYGDAIEGVSAARRAAEAANRAKDEFLATVSHELRNPLSPILTWSRLLQTRTLPPDKTANALAAIERGARSQAQLIDDLLDVSRIVAGRLRLDVRPTDLGPVVGAAVETVRPAAEAKQIKLTTVIDPRAGLVAGDGSRLQQVVWNLVSNAIKFTPRGGRVQVRVERVSSHVELTVTDNGAGIAPDVLPRVFERFWQAQDGTNRRQGGLGLGLAIVRHLVELHGGSVSVHSDGQGHGSVFRVTLPVMLTTADASSASRRHPVAHDGDRSADLAALSGTDVLVVDDEPDTVESVRALLAACGASVRTATSVREALSALDGSTLPAVIVSDIGMPEEDGYELVRRLRERPPERGGTIPAVAVTAYARVEDRVKALAAGFQMHVAKPLDPSELVAVVASLSGRSVDGA